MNRDYKLSDFFEDAAVVIAIVILLLMYRSARAESAVSVHFYADLNGNGIAEPWEPDATNVEYSISAYGEDDPAMSSVRISDGAWIVLELIVGEWVISAGGEPVVIVVDDTRGQVAVDVSIEVDRVWLPVVLKP